MLSWPADLYEQDLRGQRLNNEFASSIAPRAPNFATAMGIGRKNDV
jgi:hypothetical protein